jgi:chloride channel protein, CIC family
MLVKFLRKLHYWRVKYIGNHTFLIIASIIVGVVSALAAIVLKILVHQLHRIPEYFSQGPSLNFWYLLLPFTGIVITVMVTKIFFKGKLEKGLGNIIFAVSRKSSKVDPDKMYSQLITSGITIGLGGSAGLEAPIAITGSAIGSNIAGLFNLGSKERALLLACGAASGIAAVFNSPIAGTIFALEVLLTDFTIPVFIPLLISTASAIIVSKLLYRGQLFYLISNDWYYHAIPFYIILGIVCGLISVYMTRVTLYVENYFHKKKRVLSKAIAGGLVLSILIFILPPLFGEGYDTIKNILTGSYSNIINHSFLEPFKNNAWAILIFTVAVILVKVFATSLTIGSGGNGGIFAPSLFTGALTGFALSFFINTTGISNLNVSNFIVVGMAGILSGVVHAPLTAIFLIAEITGGYVLFVPLMIVSALSYFISRYFEPYSIYTKKLAEKGQLLTGDKDKNILSYLYISELLEIDFVTLDPDDAVNKLVDAFARSNRSVFPVIDKECLFLGIIYLEKTKSILLNQSTFKDTRIKDIMDVQVTAVNINDDMTVAMQKFDQSGQWNLPVLENGKYLGFISKSNVFVSYRNLLRQTATLY